MCARRATMAISRTLPGHSYARPVQAGPIEILGQVDMPAGRLAQEMAQQGRMSSGRSRTGGSSRSRIFNR